MLRTLKSSDPATDNDLAAEGLSAAPTDAQAPETLRRLKAQLHHALISGMDISVLATLPKNQLQAEVRRVADELCQRSTNLLNRAERERLITEVLDETFGLGPLEPLMRDPSVTDILINGPSTVYVERNGRLEPAPVTFTDSRHLLH